MTAVLPGAITSEHSYEVPIGRAEVWDLITDVGAYRSWWAWLRRFDATGFEAGDQWQCVVQPPLPYLVRFGITLERVEPPRLVHALVTGDVVGTATLELDDDGTGCIARLSSTLAPGNAALRLVSRLAAPVARFGHDWVLDSGARQFVARAVTPTLTD